MQITIVLRRKVKEKIFGLRVIGRKYTKPPWGFLPAGNRQHESEEKMA